MADRTNPIRETDDAARALAGDLLRGAVTAALGVVDPDSDAPFVSRIAFGLAPGIGPVTLISDLAHHARAIRADPRVSVLIGEPGAKGDPLTHPRLTMAAIAHSLAPTPAERAALGAGWLVRHPKARLYIDFADFRFVALDPRSALLNGGFARAYALSREDIMLALT